MASQTDDVGALFKSIGADRNSYRELTRSAEAADSEDRWPLLKSIPPERRQSPPPLSNLHKNQVWTSQENTAPRDRGAPRNFTGLGEKLAKSLLKITEGNLPFASSNASAPRTSDGYRAAPATQTRQQNRASDARFEAVEARERQRNNAQFATAPSPQFQSRIDQRAPAYAPPQARAMESERRGFSAQSAAQSRPAESGRGMFSNQSGPTNAGRGLFAPEPAPQPARQSGQGLFAREAPARQTAANSRADGSLQSIFKSLDDEPDNAPSASGSRATILGRLNRR